MISKKTRVFKIDDKKYVFDSKQFKWLFDWYKREHNLKTYELEEKLAEKIFLSREAIHNWRYNLNGPSDVETVNKVACFFGLEDNALLLEIQEENNMNNQFTEQELDTIKEFYCEVLDYFNIFSWKFGFTTCLEQYLDDENNISGKEEQKKLFGALKKSLNKKYFLLHKFDIYDQLEGFLADMELDYEEKMSTIVTDEDLDNTPLDAFDEMCLFWQETLDGIIIDNILGEYQANTAPLSERQKKAFQTFYEFLIDFIDEYEEADHYDKFLRDNQISSLLSYKKFGVESALKKEWIDLGNHQIYQELEEVTDILQKLIPDFYEEDAEQRQTYSLPIRAEAMKKLNSIVLKYIK